MSALCVSMITPFKIARRKRALTQSALAKIAGIDQANVSRIESGSQIPTPEVAEKLAKALRISELQIFYPHRYKNKE